MSIDWTKSMVQSYEFYEVDPGTWKNKRRLDNIIKCTISRDSSTETLGSATIDCSDDFGELYVRAYMTPIQNGITYHIPLGTYIAQTPSESFNGQVTSISLDAYSPLLELKDTRPPIGFTVSKNTNVMETAVRLCRENMRAPVIPPVADASKTLYDNFVANTDDTWLTFLTDLIANANFEFGLDELGQVIFEPIKDTASMQPVWAYDDSNSSILYPDISVERDLYGIPNVVEVVFSSEGRSLYSKVVNDDKNSPISTVNRGREIHYRETSPSISGNPTQGMLDEYAEKLLRNLSTLEYTVSYKHGYSPARVGDCVRLNYKRAGITNVKAKIISQSFSCETGCSVTEKAVYTNKLWGD